MQDSDTQVDTKVETVEDNAQVEVTSQERGTNLNLSDSSETTTQEVVSEPEPVVVEEKEVVKDFRDFLDEDLRNHKSLTDVKDINSLVKQFIHQKQLIGKRVTDMSAEEFKNAYRDKVGAPKSPDEYSFDGLENADPEAMKYFKEVFHEGAFTDEQGKLLVTKYAELEKRYLEKAEAYKQQMYQNGVEALKKEWGKGFERQLNIAKKTAKELAGPEILTELAKVGLDNNPKIIKFFAKLGESMGEDTLVGEVKRGTMRITPSEADKLLKQLMADPEKRAARFNDRHPAHQAVIEEFNELNQLKMSSS